MTDQGNNATTASPLAEAEVGSLDELFARTRRTHTGSDA